MKNLSRALFTVLLLAFALGLARAEDRFFDSKGVKIHYTVEGKGEPVVLIHGLNSNLESWNNLAKALSMDYQVIALDCRGHGKSDKPLEAKQYGKEMGEDVIRLLDHLHVKKAHLVGYSMGAFISYNLLFAHPDRILTVTLGAGGGITPPGTADTLKSLADSLEKEKSFEPLIKFLWPPELPTPTPDQIKAFNQILLAKKSDDDIKVLVAVCRGGIAAVPDLSKEEIDAKLKAETIPILGIVGSSDPLKKNLVDLQAHMKELQGDKSHLTLIIIEKGNHMDTGNKPEFLKNLQEFLKAHQELEKEKSTAR